ncbi:MAG: hypothetical protein J1F61_03335 [Clostridiales bacterium]|nr:hypothetical protein [Clostridiales bacterium]
MIKNKKLIICLFILAFCLCCVAFAIGKSSKKSIVASADTSMYSVATASAAEVNISSDEIERPQPVENESKAVSIGLSSNREIRPMIVGGSPITIKGNLKWKDDYGKSHPLIGVRVQIDENAQSTTYTDNSGDYVCSITYLGSSVVSVSVVVYTVDRYNNIEIKNEKTQKCYSHIITSGFNATPGQTYTLDDEIDMSTTAGKAFQISQAMFTARNFANKMDKKMPHAVTVYFPSGDHAYYYVDERVIRIADNEKEGYNLPNSYASWDMLMHEYGHHISTVGPYNRIVNGEHDIRDDLSFDYGKEYGAILAWAESWPTVFGMLAQKYYVEEEKLLDTNIKTVGDTRYTAYNKFNIDINTSTNRLGEACEESIMAILWDLFDDDIEENDTIALGYQGFWDATAKYFETFSAFIDVFYYEHPELIDEIGANLSCYGMAERELSITDNTLGTLPKFSWTRGGAIRYINNKIALKIYDSSDNLIFTVDIFENSRYIYKSYTLNESQWNQILDTEGQYFYWSLEALNDYNGIITGPYITQKQQVYKPVEVWQIGKDKPLRVMLNGQKYIWFRFIAPTAGNYTFYSEGYTDTAVELYSQLYQYENYFLASDDNSGTNKNYKISCNLKYKEVIYLKINIISAFTYFDYHVTLNYQINEYTDLYQYYGEQYHRESCVPVDKPFECLVLDTKEYDLICWQSKQIY